MKKLLIGLLVGLLVGASGVYGYFYLSDDKEPVGRHDISLINISNGEWFGDFYKVAKDTGFEVFMISDLLYYDDLKVAIFIYQGSLIGHPGYDSDSGIYKYEVGSDSFVKATAGSYHLPRNFGVRTNSKVEFKSYPLAVGCEEDPCYMPGYSYYEYDILKNEVEFVKQDPSELVEW